MIVVIIIGILAAIAIPNFSQMQARAKEAAVKSNCHTVQLAAEDWSVRNNGIYAANLAATLPSGESIIDLLGPAGLLVNPFTRVASEPVDGPAASMGQTGYQVVLQGGINAGYLIDGFGRNAIIISIGG